MFSISVWSLVVLLLCSEIIVCLEQNDVHNFITWDDLLMTPSGDKEKEGDDARVIVVDPSGSGDAQTVSAAIQMVPRNNRQRVKIHVQPGVYKETVKIPTNKPYISLIGDPKNPNKAVITGHAKATDPDGKGGTIGTFRTATVVVTGDYFCASGITFQNTATGAQAVAILLSQDKSSFYKVRFIGSQDTLLDWKGTHYFYQCFIQGATDFVCGNGRSLYNECQLSVVSPGFAIAAHHRVNSNENTGFSFVNCTVTGNSGITPYLGRSWADYSRIIYSFCKLDIDIRSGGWDDFGVKSRQNTAVFGEYQSSGKGSHTGRVPWSRSLSYEVAKSFLDITFIGGQDWLKL